MSPYRNRQFYKLLKLFRARSLVTVKKFFAKGTKDDFKGKS
jgi:hypothetical protein